MKKSKLKFKTKLSENKISLFVAALSFVIAFYTLYRTELRSPEISAYINPEIQVFYYDFYKYGYGTSVIIPMAFVNKSSSIGVIRETQLVIYKQNLPNIRHAIRWTHFLKLGDGNWEEEAEANPVAVAGKSQETKVVKYIWYSGNKPNLRITEGTYVLDLYVTTSQDSKPIKTSYFFKITKEDENAFERRIANEDVATRRIVLNDNLEQNMLLDAKGVKDFLEN
nr:hypothetical protein [uncultured Allomuricauda sp.]